MLKLSKLTLAYACYLVVSASFMRQLRSWLIETFGKLNVYVVFIVFCVLLTLAVVIAAWRRRIGYLRISWMLAILALASLLIYRQPFFTEKTHVVTYGLLGCLTMRDVLKSSGSKILPYLFALLFVVSVSAADEIFQWFLPYRVGDLRDVITNVLAGSLGILLGMVYGWRRSPAKTI